MPLTSLVRLRVPLSASFGAGLWTRAAPTFPGIPAALGSRCFSAKAGGDRERGGIEVDKKTHPDVSDKAQGMRDDCVRAVQEGDLAAVKALCTELRVEDMRAVLRELRGGTSGTRAVLVDRILCMVPGHGTADNESRDPRIALGTGRGRRPLLATPRQLIPADAEAVILNSGDNTSSISGSTPVYSFPSMEGKDVLTGQDLPTSTLLVSKANDAFYDAYETANIKTMS